MPAASSTVSSPRPRAASGVRDLFEALASYLSGPDSAVLGFIRLDGSRESVRLPEALAAITAAETEKTVLVVTAGSPPTVEWPMYVLGLAAGPRLVGRVKADAQSTVGTLRAVLSTYRDAMRPSEGGSDHAVLTVSPTCFSGQSKGRPPAGRQLLLAARAVFDIVLVDLPESTQSLHTLVDGTVLVARPEEEVTLVSGAAKQVTRHGGTVLGVVVDAAPGRSKGQLCKPRVQLRNQTRLRALGVAALIFISVIAGTGLRQFARPVDVLSADLERLSSSDVIVSNGLLTAPVLLRSGSSVAPGEQPVGESRGGGLVAEFRPEANRLPAVSQAAGDVAENEPTRSTGGPVPSAVPRAASDEVGRAGVAGVVEPKRLAEFAVRPQFTTMAGLGPVEAAVLLSAIVRADGTVDGVRLIELTGGPAGVVEPAIAAVRQWRYRPATRDGHPIDARITVLVDFRASS